MCVGERAVISICGISVLKLGTVRSVSEKLRGKVVIA